MNINVSFFDLITLIGISTGLVCSIVLLYKAKKKKSNKFLAFGILSFVWLTTKILFLSLHLWEVHGIGFFPNSVELAFAPLFYFYTVSVIDQEFQFRRKDWIHFLPFFISQTYSIVLYVLTMQTDIYAEKLEIAQNYFFNDIKKIDDYLLIVSSVFYFYFGYTYVKEKTENFKTIALSIADDIRFLRNLLFLLMFLCLIHLINLLLNTVLDHSYGWRWNLIHAVIAVIIYYMAMVGFKNADIIPKKKTERKSGTIDAKIIEKLEHAISVDKVFLNSKLTLKELAKILDVEDTLLSNCINKHYGKNFRSFINQARVDELKRRLLHGDLENLSLLGIAKECGFNSEASFYRIFKSETQITPKQFIAKNLKDISF